MADSPNLALPYIEAAQAQKHVTHNEAVRRLDAIVQLGVVARNLTAPPALPAEGARWIVAPGATGAWAGADGRVAAWQDGAWLLLAPQAGWLAFVEDEALLLAFIAGAWQPAAGRVPALGIGTPADATNRLAVATDAALFTAASGDCRLLLNKAAAGQTASVVLQSGFAARAELGLAGNDDLALKVSPDGSTFHPAFTVARDSGAVRFQRPPTLPQYAKSALPPATQSAALIYVHDASGGPAPAYADGSAWRRLSDNTPIN